jgi:anthranilate synthase component I
MSAGSVSKTVSQILTCKPDLLALHASNPNRYPFLIESALQGVEVDGALSEKDRYSILFAFPGSSLTLGGNGVLSGAYSDIEDSFLAALENWINVEHTTDIDNTFPFSGGWFLYFAYEFAAELEPNLDLPFSESQPIAIATRVPAAIIYDRINNQYWAIAEKPQEKLLGLLAEDAAKNLSKPFTEKQSSMFSPSEVVEPSADDFLTSVKEAKNYINEGEVYQANLSRQWHVNADGKKAWQFYKELRDVNPSPYAGLATFEKHHVSYASFSVISSSPERLVRINKGRVETRPIAGTRPRNNIGPISNAELDEFLTNPKERAEHVMLIDLERNDLGRICEGGSVKVNEFMAVESYSHVHHIVSNIIGILVAGTSFGQVLRAVFPGGTITGCPKVRCMEVIGELERTPRGAYTGSMGYLNRDGSCDLNILIRTMVLENDQITFSAGSGIVADSEPESELEETRAKAKGLLLAITNCNL